MLQWAQQLAQQDAAAWREPQTQGVRALLGAVARGGLPADWVATDTHNAAALAALAQQRPFEAPRFPYLLAGVTACPGAQRPGRKCSLGPYFYQRAVLARVNPNHRLFTEQRYDDAWRALQQANPRCWRYFGVLDLDVDFGGDAARKTAYQQWLRQRAGEASELTLREACTHWPELDALHEAVQAACAHFRAHGVPHVALFSGSGLRLHWLRAELWRASYFSQAGTSGALHGNPAREALERALLALVLPHLPPCASHANAALHVPQCREPGCLHRFVDLHGFALTGGTKGDLLPSAKTTLHCAVVAAHGLDDRERAPRADTRLSARA